MISDIVLLKELPDAIKCSSEAYVGCVAGASTKQEYLATLEAAGFQEIEIVSETSSWIGQLTGSIASINVHAFKPK